MSGSITPEIASPCSKKGLPSEGDLPIINPSNMNSIDTQDNEQYIETQQSTARGLRGNQISPSPRAQDVAQKRKRVSQFSGSKQRERKKLGICSTVFLILPISFNGATISLLAYQFHLVGVVLAPLIFLLSAVICVYAGYLIMATSNLTGAKTYHQLAQLTLGQCKCCKDHQDPRVERVRLMCGKCVSSLMAILNAICLMGASVAGVVFNKNVAAQGVKINYGEGPSWLRQTWFWAVVFIWGTIFPPLTCPRITCIKYISYFTSALCIAYIVIGFVGAFSFESPKSDEIEYFKPDVEGLQIAFTLFLYPLLYQPNIQTVFHQMKRPTIKRTTIALSLDTAIVVATYIIIGMLGYAHYAASPDKKDLILQKQNIFKTEGQYSKWPPNRVYALLFLSTTLTLILSCLFPVKMVLLEFFGKQGSRSCGWNTLAAIALCLLTLGFSLAINTTSLAIRIIGVTFYPVMCFVFPGLFYLIAPRNARLSRCERVHYVLALVMCLSISVFALFGLYQIIISLSDSSSSE